MVFSIANLLNGWQQAGVFDYVLPFLLIFAVVFGILEASKVLGKNKGVHVIISVVIGLLALQLNFVSVFFANVFPRLGVGLAVILTLLILTGLFIKKADTKYWMYGIAAVGVIIWIIITTKAFEGAGWIGNYFTEDYIGLVIGAVLLIGVIVLVYRSKPSEEEGDETE